MVQRSRSLIVAWMLAACMAVGSQASELEEPVRPGDRLDLSNYAGEMHISAWDQDRLRVVAEHRPGERILLARRGAVIRVRAESWDDASDALEIAGADRAVVRTAGPNPPGPVVYRVSVPAWLPLTLSGALTDVVVDDLAAPLAVAVLQGRIELRRLRGDLDLQAVAGTLRVDGAAGALRIRSWQGGAVINGTSGTLTVESTSGAIRINGHTGGGVEAVTVTGDIGWEGRLPASVGVSLASHSGNLDLALPADTDASVMVRQARGSFASEFPIAAERGRSFRFQIGSGSTPLGLESFSGRIRLTVQPDLGGTGQP